jgi:hypothetical protein
MDCSKCVWKPPERRPIRRPIRRWKDNIKMDFKEIAWDDADWIDPAQESAWWYAAMKKILYLLVLYTAVNVLAN